MAPIRPTLQEITTTNSGQGIKQLTEGTEGWTEAGRKWSGVNTCKKGMALGKILAL